MEVSVVNSPDDEPDIPLAKIAELASREERLDEIALLLVQILPAYAKKPHTDKYFQLWEEHGFHLTPVYFSQPIPDTRTLTESLWLNKPEMVGIDWNEAGQLDLLQNVFPRFQDEYNAFPNEPTDCDYEFHLINRAFGATDALVSYCIVRHLRPALIVEVGAGYSTMLLAQAGLKNGNARLISIEPYPEQAIAKGFPGLTTLIPKAVQEVELEFFEQLNAGDVLFIDSTHVVKCGSDVNYLFLEVFPRLKPGVVIHIHDIFLPHEFPRDWMLNEHLFYTEQYLLQAFLTYNSEFEILFANTYMKLKHEREMRVVFPKTQWWGGGSFWMRRRVKN
jgi:Methyltransferase domain